MDKSWLVKRRKAENEECERIKRDDTFCIRDKTKTTNWRESKDTLPTTVRLIDIVTLAYLFFALIHEEIRWFHRYELLASK